MFIGQKFIDDSLRFAVTTHDANGAEVATSGPSYRIYENEVATPILTGDMSSLDSGTVTGLYIETITLSVANGFEYDKTYTILITATVNGITDNKEYTFCIKSEAEHAIKDAATTMIFGTINTTNFGATSTEFETSAITEATADHFNGCIGKFVDGVLKGQSFVVEDYSFSGSYAHFTVNRGTGIAMTDAPSSGDKFVIL